MLMVQECTPVIPALGSLRQENSKFKVFVFVLVLVKVSKTKTKQKKEHSKDEKASLTSEVAVDSVVCPDLSRKHYRHCPLFISRLGRCHEVRLALLQLVGSKLVT